MNNGYFLSHLFQLSNRRRAGGRIDLPHGYRLAGCTKPMKRLWISSMEDSAIREGFAHLKPGRDYDPLHQSALCRAKADWLIGINATRLFSVLYHKALTVGRVQTPTLKMLADRDAKITGFQKEKYHIVHIAGGGMEAASDRFHDPTEAESVKTDCAGAQAVCASIQREKKAEQPPKGEDQGPVLPQDRQDLRRHGTSGRYRREVRQFPHGVEKAIIFSDARLRPIGWGLVL